MKFLLASASPRRKEILKSVGIEPVVIASVVDESVVKNVPPEKMCMELALLKGTDVARCADRGDVVISADTIVVSEGKILGKPRDRKNAFEILKSLSGKWHSVMTGYCVIVNSNATVRYEETRVKFKTMTDDEIEKYILTGEPMDKAGAYGIQGRGRLFAERIDGDFYNVVGLPICALVKLLKEEYQIEI